ncbi:T9SS type A sorting domain-containing protein [candidate division KSB1 bacterium]|nr:T9SS type A sorting domain-containing protein [candidate division KSB1 bacterium]
MDKFTIICEYFLFFFTICYGQFGNKLDGESFLIENGKYSTSISRTNGMLTSLKISGSNQELVTSYPNFSLFFPEYIFEFAGKSLSPAYFPSNDFFNVETELHKFDGFIVVKTQWRNRYMFTDWEYLFPDNQPWFRVAITKEVKRSGVFSNFQQCAMYAPVLANSFIVNYTGDIELTAGDYYGERAFVAPFKQGQNTSPCTSRHNLWTVFDHGEPTYFPTIAYSDDEKNIHAGIIVTYTSPNQRRTMSYHGGGIHKDGYAEAQWNWFGKSDSESLYLTKGTRFFMEMYYYQNTGSVDSLWTFCENLLSEDYIYEDIQDYKSAHWGARSSTNKKYSWRFPQVSSNSICSQELWVHNAFSIPQSRNGTPDPHLFTLDLVHMDGKNRTPLFPLNENRPVHEVFSSSDMDSCSGGVMWDYKNHKTILGFTAYENHSSVRIFGNVKNPTESSCTDVVVLAASPRASLQLGRPKHHYTFTASDPLLHSISISADGFAGFDSLWFKQDTLFCRIDKTNPTENKFNLTLSPEIKGEPDAVLPSLKVEDQYKSYFITPPGESGISYKPDIRYQVVHINKNKDGIEFDLYSSKRFFSFTFAVDGIEDTKTTILTDGRHILTTRSKPAGRKNFRLDFPFETNTQYKIRIGSFPGPSSDRFLKIINNYPNPFTGKTSVLVFLNFTGDIEFEVFNIKGEQVYRTLFFDQTGYTVLHLDMSFYNSGVYLCRVTAQDCSKVIKMTLLR